MPLNQEVGLFVPTTNVWDVSQIYQANIDNPALVELLVRLYQNINSIAIAINLKDSGIYFPQEFINGQIFFPNPANTSATQTNPNPRQVYRQVVNFGALPNATTKSVSHGITVTATTTFTRIYGTASDTTNKFYIPLPYASAAGNNAELYADATNVNIITTIDYSNFTICYVVLEYIQQ